MNFYDDALLTVFFGDSFTSLKPTEWKNKNSDLLFSQEPWNKIIKKLECKKVLFLHQVHGITGRIITKDSLNMPLFLHEGDYLITDLSSLGIGVVTADCLPLVFIDPIKKVIAIAHAGWRGLVNGVLDRVIDDFTNFYGSMISDLQIFIGPSAGACCYEVGHHFLENESVVFVPREAFFEKHGTLFFDMKRLLRIYCRKKGLLDQNINEVFSLCTICNLFFCSARRSYGASERQMTIVTLK